MLSSLIQSALSPRPEPLVPGDVNSFVHAAFCAENHPFMIYFPSISLFRGAWSAIRAAKNPRCAGGGQDPAAAGSKRVPAQTRGD